MKLTPQEQNEYSTLLDQASELVRKSYSYPQLTVDAFVAKYHPDLSPLYKRYKELLIKKARVS